MNLTNKQRNMHFKAAQISAADLSPNDMAMINAYALAPLKPEDVFAFKVSMAGNEIDRDHEMFPIATLQKLANLFVGRTVVKDHDHRSDNQIARIYATELVEGDIMRITKANEVYTELIAKCYMVKTSANADLIAEIQAGIRKEVSLGCRIGKAMCSVCGTDNVKQYCEHFPGREYQGETCYFSLEDPKDAYELSFVAIPAQQHAGTVKAYGEKPCYQAELKADAAEKTAEQADDLQKRLTVNQVEEGSTGPVEEKGAHENEALTWAVDGLAEKLEALAEKLAGVEAALETLIAKEADGLSGEPSEEPVSTEAKQNKTRLMINRNAGDTAAEAAEGEDAQGDAAEDCNQDADKGAGSAVSEQAGGAAGENEPPATGNEEGESSSVDVEETSQEELKAKQAMARLRALEMALSIRARA